MSDYSAYLPLGVLRVRVRERSDAVTRVFLKFTDRIERWEIRPYRIGRMAARFSQCRAIKRRKGQRND